jgi:methionyl aminopeptidase
MIKTKTEIEKIRKASQMVGQTLEMLNEHIKPGITTDEINSLCHEYITKTLGATPACLNYKGFPKSICTSVNHVICHGIPGDKKLKDGDILNVDITIEHDGYHGDSAKMFLIGKPTILGERLVKVTKECLDLGIAAAKPGNRLGDIGYAISQHAAKHNFSVVEEYCGHGIGKTLHEEPQVLHYGRPGTGLEIKEGMVFTIEPMINAGKKQNKILADGWTVVTRDKSLSAQWEHTIAITDSGAEILTLRKEEKAAG